MNAMPATRPPSAAHGGRTGRDEVFARRRAWCLASLLVVAIVAGPVPSALADADSLYRGPGPRPGPALLYAPAPRAPQLENAPGSVWRAAPILVSGASAYRDGEFLYQDYLYDDAGAVSDTATQLVPANAQRGYSGKYTYPSDPRYGGNAADVVELRLRLLEDATAIRVTMNTMIDPSLVAVTVALGGGDGVPRQLPHGAAVQAPADVFVTAHAGGDTGMVAALVDAETGTVVPDHGATARVDVARAQIEIVVPHDDWHPGDGHMRLAYGAGLWDVSANRYLVPQASRSETRPGGAGSLANPPAFFNVGPRYTEPFNRVPDAAANADTINAWREMQQATELAAGDISDFAAEVDLGKLIAGEDDDMADQVGGTPTTGYLNRIFASHFGLPAGRGSAGSLQPASCPTPCAPTNAGQLQPYELYVPPTPPPTGRWAFTLDLHPAGGNHNEQLGSRRQRQLGARAGGSLVMTPNGRGTTYWYYGQGEADVFEAWADVARHYPLDPGRTAITGISMGGYGTYKLAALFPDLFATAAPIVGCTTASTAFFTASATTASSVVPLVASYRHVPVMSWATPADEFCPYSASAAVRDALEALRYRYAFWTVTGEHLSLSIIDDFAAVAAFMGDARVERDPAHVTYVLNAQMDEERFGLGTDHVYWLSGLELRDHAAGGGRGTIDVVSRGLGRGDAAATPVVAGAGVLAGGLFPAVYTSETRRWGPVPTTPAEDALVVRATNVATVEVHVDRAGITCDAAVEVVSDGPLTVDLVGCDRTVVHRG